MLGYELGSVVGEATCYGNSALSCVGDIVVGGIATQTIEKRQ